MSESLEDLVKKPNNSENTKTTNESESKAGQQTKENNKGKRQEIWKGNPKSAGGKPTINDFKEACRAQNPQDIEKALIRWADSISEQTMLMSPLPTTMVPPLRKQLPLNSLSEEARSRRDSLNMEINLLLSTTVDKNGDYHREDLSDEDYLKLQELETRRRNLANPYYPDGSVKTSVYIKNYKVNNSGQELLNGLYAVAYQGEKKYTVMFDCFDLGKIENALCSFSGVSCSSYAFEDVTISIDDVLSEDVWLIPVSVTIRSFQLRFTENPF